MARSWAEPSSESHEKPPFSEEEKTFVRENVLQALIAADPAIRYCKLVWCTVKPLTPSSLRVQVAVCLKNVATHDYPEKGPSLLPGITQCLVSQNLQQALSEA